MNLSIFSFNNRDSRRTAATLVCFAVLLTVIGALKAWLLAITPPEEKAIADRFWLAKTHSDATWDIVFIGDSRIYRGIDPSTVEQQLSDVRAFNLGYMLGGLSEPLLSEGVQRLDPHGRRIIVLGVSPLSLTLQSSRNEQFAQYRERSTLPLLVPYNLWTLFDKDSTMTALSTLTKRLTKDNTGTRHGYYQVPHANGWVASDKRPSDPSEELSQYQSVFNGNEVSDKVVDKLLATVKTWTERGIQVYAFRPPASKAIESVENTKSGYNENALARRLEKAGAVWIDIANRYQYHAYDGSHLRVDSAKSLSRYIGKRMHAAMSGNGNNLASTPDG